MGTQFNLSKTTSPNSLTCTAYEPLNFGIQLANLTGVPRSLTSPRQRKIVWKIYRQSGTNIESLFELAAEIRSTPNGEFASWSHDGFWTRDLAGEPNLLFEISERINNGKYKIVGGTFTIEPSPTIEDYDDAPTFLTFNKIVCHTDIDGDYKRARFSVTDEQVENIAAPAFTVAPSVSPTTSGTAGTSEYTASDGAADNAVSFSRRWLLSGVSIGTGVTVIPNAAGALVLEVSATNAGGTTTTTTPAVIIGAAATLSALTLSANSIAENSATGTVVGTINGAISGSTLTLFDTAGNRFALSGNIIVAGSVATDFETSPKHNITVRETLAGASNSPRDTVLAITVSNVFEQPNLSALTLSSTSYAVGSPSNGTIIGATNGSTITASNAPSGFTIDSAARTWAWSGSGTAGTQTVTLTETLSDSANSPRATSISLTITATVKVLFEGDSIVATTSPASWARLWAAAQSGVTSANYAVGGSGVSTMVSRQSAALAYGASHLIVGIGANDLLDNTASYMSGLWNYTDQFRAAGTKVIVVTVLPRTNVTNWSTKRANFRAALIAAKGSKIDDYIDFDPTVMGVDGAENDAVKYPDGLHPSASGHATLKRAATPVINFAIGVPNEPLDLAFQASSGATVDADVDSSLYTVAGFYAGESRPYSVSAGTKVSKNGGAFATNGSGTVVNGDTLRLRVRSSTTAATQVDGTLTVGTTATAFSVVTAGAGSRDWVPTDLGDKLMLWLKPESLTGANGTGISSWPDSSSANRTVTGAGNGLPVTKTNGLAGMRTVVFEGSYQRRFSLPNFMQGQASAEGFFVQKLNNDPAPTHMSPPLANFGTDGTGEFYPYSNGTVYSSFASTTRQNCGNPAPPLTEWRFGSFRSAPSDWRYYIDGTAAFTTVSNTVAHNTAPAVGSANSNGADCEIAEIVVTKGLTDLERQQLHAYQAWKFGLQANLPNGHPFKTDKPTASG